METTEAEQAIARIELLCAFWDRISKGETSTTRQIRAAIRGGDQPPSPTDPR